MCGRFTIISDPNVYQMEFDLPLDVDIKQTWKPRYNVAPSQQVPVVNNAEERGLKLMQWGIIPAWSKDDKGDFRLINIRSETIMEKVTFRKLMQQGQRCIILADGFYEWQKQSGKGKTKIPFYFHLKENKPFAFAGLWGLSRGTDGQTAETCAIITCAPNALVSDVHNRMPVILDAGSGWEWLSREPIPNLLSLLKPYPENEMTAFPVSTVVNNPAADTPECILPASAD